MVRRAGNCGTSVLGPSPGPSGSVSDFQVAARGRFCRAWGWGGLGIGWGRPGGRATHTSSFQIYTVERMNSRLQKRVFYVDETSFCKMDRLSAGHAKHTTFQKWCFTETKPLLFIMLNLSGGAQCFEHKSSDSRSLRTKNEV